ncbi:MAG: bifunctional oligoribonuclease/PAP phosphatase NrnA [Candidatus Gracilibacteria bacterium]|nr:bifunctional oligoribonuclease/PAP phosphatase NrnA [Candidatus Gracilibacteria bacterium]
MIQFDNYDIEKLKNTLANAKKILLISHRSPDGDTLGSTLAWYFALLSKGKIVYPFCVDPLPDKMQYLPAWDKMTNKLPNLESIDLVIINDHGDLKLSGLNEVNDQILARKQVINIDHHPSNDFFGHQNFVFTDAASCTQIVTQLLKKLGFRITPDMATLLLNGLYTDTGSFQHSNTSPAALETAALLMSYGANWNLIVKNAFKTLPVSTMKLWGHVLANMNTNAKGITSSTVTEHDLEDAKADSSELEGVVNFLNAVPNTKFSVLLSERGDVVKGSLRTPKDDVDVAKIASFFGGGGHVKAAGFAVKGKIQREKNKQGVVA